ncbi:MAG: exodeoxyribonuclease III [Candidatus Moranbacteria bacterium]|nr:exodeoxyribonuclease III [Candidatus Moranbacteria bacterium]
MEQIRILSWNVNGLRAVYRKGFLDWFLQQKPDILALQETKAREDQLVLKIKNIKDYYAYFTSASNKKGYSGTAVYSKIKPLAFKEGMDNSKFDQEGRVQILEYESFYLFNIYFPNGRMNDERLKYKMAFYDYFLDFVKKYRKNKDVVICGDFNTAHREIDLARPKANKDKSGFLPEERAWMDKFIDSGFVDTFRMFNQEGENYTYWDLKSRARDRNVGWRIDYFFVNKKARSRVKKAFILSEVSGSDHCPVGIDFGR